MIKNFDAIKEQLKELAGVINSFKSEAVQLRLIELVFEQAEAGSAGESGGGTPAAGQRPRRKSRKATVPATQKEGDSKPKGSGRPGGKAMLDRLHGEGFFKKPNNGGRCIFRLLAECVAVWVVLRPPVEMRCIL